MLTIWQSIVVSRVLKQFKETLQDTSLSN